MRRMTCLLLVLAIWFGGCVPTGCPDGYTRGSGGNCLQDAPESTVHGSPDSGVFDTSEGTSNDPDCCSCTCQGCSFDADCDPDCGQATCDIACEQLCDNAGCGTSYGGSEC